MWLLANWKWIAGIVLALGIAGALFATGWHVRGLSADAALSKLKDQQDAEDAARLNAVATAWQNETIARQSREDRYQNEIDSLRDQRLSLGSRPVWVCPQPAAAAVPPAPTAGTREPAADGVVLGNAGPVPAAPRDYGRFLYGVAGLADHVVAECRRTQP